MGKIQRMDARLSGSGLTELHILIRRDLARRLDTAANAVDQNRSAWIRMAIMEKLTRDGG